MRKAKMWLGSLIGVFALGMAPLYAADDLMNKSLEDLLSMPVTSAAGREQKKNEVSQSMFVITKEDIARSGAHNIPDLFYRVPGMQVRKVSGNEYYVGIRSTAVQGAANLLVMVDGVVLFNPILSGTFWGSLPVTLEEIERIEIIRGPGGVLYSSNAVNGVINIITRKASEKNNYAATRGGTMNFWQQSIGMGQKVNDKLSVRAFVQHDRTSGFNRRVPGVDFPNESVKDIMGLKAQYDWSEGTSLVLDAKGNDETATKDTVSGNKRKPYDQAFVAQFRQKVNESYDYTVHVDDNHAAIADDYNINTVSGSTQHNLKYAFLGDHVMSVGSELRYSRLNAPAAFNPPSRDYKNSQRILSFFAQDEYRPAEKLILTAGARATDNTLVNPKKGELVEPRGSIVYLLNDKQSLRAVVSRTYRTPSFIEKYGNISNALLGDWTVAPEKNLTYEAGWQGQLLEDRLNMNAAVFYSFLDDLLIPSSGYPTIYGNNGSLNTKGFEWDGSYKLTEALSCKADYTYTIADAVADHRPQDARDRTRLVSKHQVGAGVDYVKGRLTLGTYLKWVSKYANPTAIGYTPYRKYPSYYKTTVRLAYAFKMPWMKMKADDAEIELVANDFIGGRTTESSGLGANTTLFREPDIFAGLKIKF